MHDQPIADRPPTDGVRDLLVLDMLVNEHAGLWTIDELKRMYGDPTAVEDVLARLAGLGLVHRIEDCVFATRAAAHVMTAAEAA